MIEKIDNAKYSNDDIIFAYIDSDIVTYISDDIGHNSINPNNINFDDDDFSDCGPETINHYSLLAWYVRYKEHKACEKR